MPASRVRELYSDGEATTKLVCRGEFDAQKAAEAFNAVPEYASAAVVGSADIPAQASGSVEVSMPIDAAGLDGRGAVVFELIARDAGDGMSEALAIHADPDDFGQSVWFTKASIGTELVDATDGDHEALNSKSAKLTDTIRYEGLVKGKQYLAKGWLVDKSTGQPVFANDKKVEATAAFVANDSSGTATVEFEFDASQLAGVDAVAFEELWLDSSLGRRAQGRRRRGPDGQGHRDAQGRLLRQDRRLDGVGVRAGGRHGRGGPGPHGHGGAPRAHARGGARRGRARGKPARLPVGNRQRRGSGPAFFHARTGPSSNRRPAVFSRRFTLKRGSSPVPPHRHLRGARG